MSDREITEKCHFSLKRDTKSTAKAGPDAARDTSAKPLGVAHKVSRPLSSSVRWVLCGNPSGLPGTHLRSPAGLCGPLSRGPEPASSLPGYSPIPVTSIPGARTYTEAGHPVARVYTLSGKSVIILVSVGTRGASSAGHGCGQWCGVRCTGTRVWCTGRGGVCRGTPMGYWGTPVASGGPTQRCC